MSADILLFIPRANPKADRAFWKGHDSDCAVNNAPALPVGPCDCADTAPSEYNSGWVSDSGDESA